ncbi:YcjX family protein [Paracoccaceae bacterium GXU_MW_L88]
MLGIGTVVDSISRQVGQVQDGVGELFFDPVIRLGVTGLSRAGKTMFITSLVANLLNRGRMPQFSPAADGRLQLAFLQPQPDDHLPRFDYETHLNALTGPEPFWPDSTSNISQLRLSLRVKPSGMLAGMRSVRTVHLDIVDYPGEWLLDLPLMNQGFAAWSQGAIAKARQRADHAGAYLAQIDGIAEAPAHDETVAKTLAANFTDYLRASREAGFSDCAPGRFLMPGDLDGSPALTFSPLPENLAGSGLYKEMARRYEAYKRVVVRPFFRDHFARIDRQVVLVDLLSAIHQGPQAVEDLRQTLTEILTCFRPGANNWLTTIMGKRVEKILLAATKADYLHHTQHPELTALTEALLRDAADRAKFSGASVKAMSLAALRTTTEQMVTHDGQELPCVRGTLEETGKQVALYPGKLPSDPAHLLTPARQGATDWLDADFDIMKFAPPKLTLKPGDGPPHIRMDRAAEFLLADRL